VIGIAGGSGSGKTTAADIILQKVGRDRIAYLQHDSYYRDLSDLPLNQRREVNFDHPDSLESGLMMEHILELKIGMPSKFRFMISPRIIALTRPSILSQKG